MALRQYFDNQITPKIYKVLLNQTGTNAPVATVIKNNLSGLPVWSRTNPGIYRLTLNGEFNTLNTTIYCGNQFNNTGTLIIIKAAVASANQVEIQTWRFNDLLVAEERVDDLITDLPFELLIYA
jgi:hypothetical protein